MRAVRWSIIWIAQIFILLIVLLVTAASATSAYYSIQFLTLQGNEVPFTPAVGAAIAGVVGFVTMAVFSATFFLLVEIANNTRRTVAFFQHLLDRGNGGEQ
jgi:hypothetical protein